MRIVCAAGGGGGIPVAWAGELADRLRALGGITVDVVDAGWQPAADRVDCLIAGVGLPALRELPPEVGWVQIWGTGVDGLPPAVLGGDRVVTCARGASAVPIAEFVLASLLAVAKRFPDVWITRPPAAWAHGDLEGLAGRRLAILGLGAIGTAVARLGLAFSMSVVGLRGRQGPSPVEGVALAADVGDLVDGADHVVVAAPATPATRHLVGPAVFARMGPGAHLVNVARGSLVDQEALQVSLGDGRVAWATLDVADPEPLPSGHWLYAHPRVRLSPHVSWSGAGAQAGILAHCVANVAARLDGRPLRGIVDPVAGY